MEVNMANAQVLHALLFAGAVSGALVVSHLSMVCYIAYHDLNGHWDKYSLKYQRMYQRNTIKTYTQHTSSFFFDVFCLLLPALCIYGYYYCKPLWVPILKYPDVHSNIIHLVAMVAGSCVNNIVNRLWAMGVHWVMHKNAWLYRNIHKKHHCALQEMCALSAWQDTIVEFVVMEVFGVFLFAQLFNPLPWPFHVAMAVYNGVGGAIDHAGFYIPNSLIDGRYHWNHHLLLHFNFSEMEILDRIFGTLYIWPPEPEYLQASTSFALEQNRSLTMGCGQSLTVSRRTCFM